MTHATKVYVYNVIKKHADHVMWDNFLKATQIDVNPAQ